MLKIVLAGMLAVIFATTLATAQDAAETAAWETAQQSATSDEVFAFIEQYPNSVFAKDAKAYMIDLLWQELAVNAPEPTTPVEVPVETTVEATGEAPVETTAATPVALNSTVLFRQPLSEGSPHIVGRTLEELIASTPLFPPVEGLPEEYWKEQQCSNCHEWEQANLCTQANTYLSDAGGENLVKNHPYGGTFKQNLRSWAQDGCE